MLDGFFHFLHGNVWMVTGGILPPDAKEVVILAAVAPGPLHNEPLTAAVTEQPALEVVRVLAFADTGPLVGVEYALYPLK
nr:hypothetical protein [Phytohabitans suffuscus]